MDDRAKCKGGILEGMKAIFILGFFIEPLLGKIISGCPAYDVMFLIVKYLDVKFFNVFAGHPERLIIVIAILHRRFTSIMIKHEGTLRSIVFCKKNKKNI